jgi:phosphoribosylanthranilate isomerase
MMLDIKICGLKTPEALAAALDGGASHIGFIFFPEKPAQHRAGTGRSNAAGGDWPRR